MDVVMVCVFFPPVNYQTNKSYIYTCIIIYIYMHTHIYIYIETYMRYGYKIFINRPCISHGPPPPRWVAPLVPAVSRCAVLCGVGDEPCAASHGHCQAGFMLWNTIGTWRFQWENHRKTIGKWRFTLWITMEYYGKSPCFMGKSTLLWKITSF